MSSTYLSLTNRLLRRLNEVVIDETDFSGARNVQALAKDSINYSIREILSYVQEWPFTTTSTTQVLTAGTQEYDFPSDLHVVDWGSFFLQKDDSLSPTVNGEELDVISYDEYQSNYRANDANMLSSSYAKPERIYRTQQTKFGVSPPPDQAYTIAYVYNSFPADLVAFSDTTVVPARFDHVILEGAMVYMMRFRSNDPATNYHTGKFKEGLEFMRRVLLDPPDYFRANVVGG
jgi:hypothetical protein